MRFGRHKRNDSLTPSPDNVKTFTYRSSKDDSGGSVTTTFALVSSRNMDLLTSSYAKPATIGTLTITNRYGDVTIKEKGGSEYKGTLVSLATVCPKSQDNGMMDAADRSIDSTFRSLLGLPQAVEGQTLGDGDGTSKGKDSVVPSEASNDKIRQYGWCYKRDARDDSPQDRPAYWYRSIDAGSQANVREFLDQDCPKLVPDPHHAMIVIAEERATDGDHGKEVATR